MIRRLLKGKIVQAFRSVTEDVGPVKASEWEPLLPIQPHSEFPSASALICKASLDHLELALQDVIGKNGTLPSYFATFSPGTLPGSPLQETITLKFNSLKQAAKSCGMSRLWAGVHFAPSIQAGFELATGVGEMAYLHVRDLYEGRIPKNCARCIEPTNE